MGADRGIHVKTDNDLEPLAISKIISKVAEEEKPSIILMGKQAIDDDCNQTGQMTSAILNWPQATFASKIEIEGQNAIVTREIDEGLERIKVSIPFVASCDLRLNEPRYASLPNIMKAKKKPIDTKEASSLGINIEPRIEQIKVEEPPVRQKGIMVSDVAELVQKLKHEAKVI
jgi:electron transfer flavoprotein beta subunit